MANVAPLLDLATVVTTEAGEDLDFSYVATLPTPNGIVADGASITPAYPTSVTMPAILHDADGRRLGGDFDLINWSVCSLRCLIAFASIFTRQGVP